jgi:hypothetical protein
MSRSQFFNASSSEAVLSQLPIRGIGEDFNLLNGATSNALPAILGTSQGNSNSVWTSNKNKTNTTSGSPLTPYGTLVRNLGSDQYTSNAPYFNPVTNAIKNGLTAPIFVPLATEQAWVGNGVFGKPTYGSPLVQITNFTGSRDNYSVSVNNNTSGHGGSSQAVELIPNVGSRLYRA